jgi:hypothetical protein
MYSTISNKLMETIICPSLKNNKGANRRLFYVKYKLFFL